MDLTEGRTVTVIIQNSNFQFQVIGKLAVHRVDGEPSGRTMTMPPTLEIEGEDFLTGYSNIDKSNATTSAYVMLIKQTMRNKHQSERESRALNSQQNSNLKIENEKNRTKQHFDNQKFIVAFNFISF